MSWAKHRRTFNHDWLMNRFIPALAKYLNLLNYETEDFTFEHSFILTGLSVWESRRIEAIDLINTFEWEMSPQRLFDHLPLSEGKNSTKYWLGNLVHSLWLARYPVRQLVAETCDAIQQADNAYKRLQESLSGCADITSAHAIRPFKEQFAEFYRRCQHMASTFSRFPNEIKVV